MFSHFRHAFRSLSRTPGFTLVAILTLALGIGISTSSFSTTNAFLLRSLPYPQSDDLVRVFRVTPQVDTANHSPAVIIHLQENLRTLEDVTPYYFDQTSISEPGQPPEQVNGICAGANILNTLRVQPVLGRGFSPEDGQEGKGQGIVITDKMWHKRFAGDPEVIHRTVRINGEKLNIIGVLPASFEAPLIWANAEFIRPWVVYPTYRTLRKDTWLDCVGRLKPGVSLDQVNSEVATVASSIARDFPKEHATDGLRAVGFAASNMGGINSVLIWLITGLAMAVLLVACANLASLQLARAFGRTREFAIRSSLGASRLQLMAPLLAESLLLALFGGLLGLLFASWINEYMSNALLINNEPGFDIGMDLRVLAFAGATSLLTGLAFGLVPAWLASRVSAAAAMKEGARGSTAGPSHNRLRFGLVVAEIALSLVLVATAAAFAIASKNMLHRELGWQPAQVFQTTIALPYNRYPDDITKREFNRALLEKLQSIPGVDKATICSSLPIFSYFLAAPVVAEGMDDTDPTRTPRSEMSAVSPDFFSLLRIPLKEGSLFNPNLAPEGPAVTVINESLAKRLWPNESALGKRLRIGDAKELTEVIGVVGNVRMAAGLSAPASPYQLYRPLTRHPHNYIAVALRGSASPENLTTSVRRAVYEIDQDLTLLFPASIKDFMAQVFSNLDILIVNLAAYACMALLISGIGIYGVISHLTAQRTRDIGVRMALGAQQGEIMRMVLRQGFKLLLIGLVLGVIGTSLLMKVLDANLTGFDLPGPWLQALTVLLLAAVTLLACYLPARRASLIDPVIALRAD